MSLEFKQSIAEKAKHKQEGKIVIFSGISGSGKNVIADILETKHNYVILDKYVTRAFRPVEIKALQQGKKIGIKAVSGLYNDGEKDEQEQEKLFSKRKQAFLNLRLPIAYVNYDNYYGFSVEEINTFIQHGRNVVVIVNDLSVVKDLKNIYKEKCLAIYIHRALPKSEEKFMEIARQRGDNEKSAKKRYQKSLKDFERYTNNIALYDHTVLNTENGIEKVSKMMEELNSGDFKKVQKREEKKQGKAKIYVYAGSPGSGKDEALETIRVQGILHSIILPKHTTRLREEKDGEEMICAGDDMYNMDECDIQYESFGETYGIITKELKERLEDGISSSVVISNLKAIKKLKEIFPDEVVTIYMQGLSKEEYIEKNKDCLDNKYVQKRIAEYEKADKLYYEQWLDFNHIIIDNGDLLDLKAQIDSIQRYYEEGRDLSIEKYRKYMSNANKYIERFAISYSLEQEKTI